MGAGGAPQRGDGASLEPLAQLGDALGGVGAEATGADTAEPIAAQADSIATEEREQAVTQKRTLRGGGALQRGQGAPLDPLAERSDALSGAHAMHNATELVAGQTAMGGTRVVSEQVCQRALTQKRTLGRRRAREAFDLRLWEDFHELEQA